MTPPPPTALDPHAGDFLLRRLDELYKAKAYEHADGLVDELLEIYPNTETAAHALCLRSLSLRTRDDQEAAFWDLLTAADQGTGRWSMQSGFRAGVQAQMMKWYDRARVVFELVAAKWSRDLTAVSAARELSYIHRDDPEKRAFWKQAQVDLLHRLICNPKPDSDEDLDALSEAVEIFLERDDDGGEPRDLEKATSCAQELLRRATERGQRERIRDAELGLIAIESRRPLNLVRVLESQGDNPRMLLGKLD